MSLKNKKILIFVGPEYEDLELHYPKYRLKEEGIEIVVAGHKSKEKYSGKKGYPCISDISFEDVNVTEYSGLIIPGGYAPDKIRAIPKALEIVRQFDKEQKLIAFICHAGWLPISAKIIEGVRCTSFSAIKDDMINAGALWYDEAVVIDRHFISSRSPEDLPYFCLAIIQFLNQPQKV